MFFLAKFLELCGLCTTFFGLLLGLTDESAFGTEMKLFAVGGTIFVIGWLLEKNAADSG